MSWALSPRVRSAVIAACVLAATLVTSSGASAHVVPVPQFLTTGAVTTVSFSVPNERPEPMSGVTISVPAGFDIVRARPTAGWTATVDGSTSTWQGGPLAHLSIETFRLDVDVSAAPGPATLDTLQRYPSAVTVNWPATLTVVPGEDEQSQSVGWGLIAAVAGAGLIVAAGVAVLAWRR